jgi:tetratricopeptide (TPR) repeat protein
MNRVLLSAVFSCALAFPASADDADICADGTAALEDRVSACQRQLEIAEDRVEALVDLGRAYEANALFDEAIVHYSEALALYPDSSYALGRRSVALGELGRWGEAEADLRQLTLVTPGSRWAHYRLGWLLLQTDRPQDALMPLQRSIEIDRDYIYSWNNLAIAYDRLGNFAESGWARREAARLEPFSVANQVRAFQAFEEANLIEEAAYHARIAFTLDPNETYLEQWLAERFDAGGPIDLPPLGWSMSSENQEIRYISIRAPVETREETEIAIGDLLGFFTGTARPRPETAVIMRVRQAPVDEDYTLPQVVVEAEASATDAEGVQGRRYRGMFPFVGYPMGPDGPEVGPIFDTGTPSDAWPLIDGNQAAGQGRFVVDCSRGRGFQYSVLGCIPGVEIADVGVFDWSIAVSTERIHVPLGLFETYRLDLALNGSVTALGVTNDIPYEAIFWIDPALNTWVARRLTAEGEYIYHQAMDVLDVSQTESE